MRRRKRRGATPRHPAKRGALRGPTGDCQRGGCFVLLTGEVDFDEVGEGFSDAGGWDLLNDLHHLGAFACG